jgi:hypothetical protein
METPAVWEPMEAAKWVVVVPLMLLFRIQGVDSLVELPPLLCSAPWIANEKRLEMSLPHS